VEVDYTFGGNHFEEVFLGHPGRIAAKFDLLLLQNLLLLFFVLGQQCCVRLHGALGCRALYLLTAVFDSESERVLLQVVPQIKHLLFTNFHQAAW